MQQRPPAFSSQKAKEKILLLLDEGKYELSLHCRYESMPKRSINELDIFSALETGEIRREPEWSDEHQNWKYRVEGFDADGDDLTAVTVILDEILIVTAF